MEFSTNVFFKPSLMLAWTHLLLSQVPYRGQVRWLGPLLPQAPRSGRHKSEWKMGLGCVHYYIRLRALLFQVACITILGCVHYYAVCSHQCVRQYIVTSLTHSQIKVYSIYSRFPRVIVRYYTLRATVCQSVCNSMLKCMQQYIRVCEIVCQSAFI